MRHSVEPRKRTHTIMTMTDRDFWIKSLLTICTPVLSALSTDSLRARMPIETNGDVSVRAKYSHLEALGRTLAGIGPWLESSPADGTEDTQRLEICRMTRIALKNATDPHARDFMNFTEGLQPLVDAAFLAQGLLRCWNSVWLQLDAETQANVIACLLATRRIKPHFNNWILFASMVEAFLYKAGCDWDRVRIEYSLRQHEQWYRGDGHYGDGAEFHADYYNSFVIHPMLYEQAGLVRDESPDWAVLYEQIRVRLRRYAAVQERCIGPDGHFPPVGRSLAYRFGAFHALALSAWKSELPSELSPASVRCAMTAVIRRMLERADVFDEEGWLRVGFCGHQPSLGEFYISTGSLYLCLCGLLPLGLPEAHPFWSDQDAPWTSLRIWRGEDRPCDHSI